MSSVENIKKRMNEYIEPNKKINACPICGRIPKL